MKKLFIYYSYTGNGDIVAKKYLELGYEIRKVIPKRNLPKSFFFSILTGGFLASIHHKSKLKDFDYDINEYDSIVIGSPIWNSRLSCPINTVLKKINLENKNVSFILYSGSGEAVKAKDYLKKKYNSNIIILKEPKKYPNNLANIKE